MGDFLDTVTHLTHDQRVKLREQELDSPDAIIAFSPEVLAATAGVTLGSAGKLHRAAQVELDRQAADRAHAQKLEAGRVALQAALDDPKPHRLTAVKRLGFTHVVLVGDRINVEKTQEMRADLDAGASVPRLWHGERVVPVDSLIEPTVFHHWRTGAALQAGKDDLTGIPWADLGLETLRLLVYGQRIDAFHGMTDAAVYEQAKSGKLTALRQRAVNEGINLADMDRALLHGQREVPPPHQEFRSTATMSGAATGRLSTLFLAMFGGDELRRFLRFLSEGTRILAGLPGPNATPAQLAFAAAEILQREGRIDTNLRTRLIEERPRRAAEINAFFDSVL